MRIRSLVLTLAWVAPALAAQTARADSARAAAAASDTGPLSLSREVFSYQGAGRDPFLSLLKSGDIRPLITDLKLVTVIYDERYAARSVAVLRDITTSKRYRVRTGDVLGRLRVTQIKPRDVVFTIQEFGFERQATLSLAKQEETP
ncbi:MAG TPA: hypothetical protein VFP39_11445 [Gemmatimonadales bacterium]|nr:hypothetical protein [Gemmatimonadales bacterium]